MPALLSSDLVISRASAFRGKSRDIVEMPTDSPTRPCLQEIGDRPRFSLALEKRGLSPISFEMLAHSPALLRRGTLPGSRLFGERHAEKPRSDENQTPRC
jgi:hypothetical protein